MSRIDYSKWDHFKDSDEEDDDEAVRPHVTRLEQPSRIVTTKGQDGFTIVPGENTTESSPSSVPTAEAAIAAQPVPSPATMGHPAKADTTTTVATVKPSVSFEVPASWTEKGGKAELPSEHATNGIFVVFWTQDRYSVTLRLVAPSTGTFTVQVVGCWEYANRHCATGTQQLPTLIVHHDLALWFQGHLPHPIHFAQDEDTIDWCIERTERQEGSCEQQRYLTITLYKAVPMEGVFCWWKRPFQQCTELTSWQNDSTNALAFAEAWNEAHLQFQESVTNKKLREI